MKTIMFCFFCILLLPGCTTWHDGYSMSRDSKKKDKIIVYPPQSFIDAVFAHKKKNYFWPNPLEAAFTHPADYKEYQSFVDKGMENMRIIKSTADTMLIDFEYSRSKNAAYYGEKQSSFPSKTIFARYEFVHDSNFVFFRVLLPKQKMFSVSFK